jgi:O-antigen ligase
VPFFLNKTGGLPPRSNLSTIQVANLILICFVLLFSPLIDGGTTYYSVAITQSLILFLLAGGIYSFYRERKFLSLKSPPFLTSLIFLFYLFILAFFNRYQLPAFQLIQLLCFYFVLFYFSINFNLIYDNFHKTVVILLIAMGLFESIYGIGQFLLFNQRSRGTFFNPDFFGEYLAIIFCLALGLLMECWPGKKVSSAGVNDFGTKKCEALRTTLASAGTHRLAGVVYLIILGLGIICSQSRGGALSWFMGANVPLFKRFKGRVLYIWIVLFLVFISFPNPLQHRFLNDFRQDPYSLSRLEMWKGAVSMIKDHPTGIGLEMYPLISPQYAFETRFGLQRYSKVAESPHNEYLRLFSEIGIFGALFFVGGIAICFLRCFDKKDRPLSDYGKIGGMIIFFIHALVDANFHEPGLVIAVLVVSTSLFRADLFKFVQFTKSGMFKKEIYYLAAMGVFISLGILIVKPALAWHFYSKGYAQLKNDQDDAAQFNYRMAILFEDKNARYHSALAHAYFNRFASKRDYHWVFRALDELNYAVGLNPIDGNYFRLKGEVYQALAAREHLQKDIQELLNEAFTNYQAALKLLPYDASLCVALGQVGEALGKMEDAGKLYDRAILLEPDYLLAREKKIENLLSSGKKEEARKNYQELILVYDRDKKVAVSDSDKAFIYFDREKVKRELEN